MECEVCKGTGFERVYFNLECTQFEDRACRNCKGTGLFKPKVLNKYRTGIPAGSVYIGRGSYWGNPFKIGSDGDRDTVIRKYMDWFGEDPERLRRARIELKGKNLVCYCAPNRCHGDFLLYIANKE